MLIFLITLLFKERLEKDERTNTHYINTCMFNIILKSIVNNRVSMSITVLNSLHAYSVCVNFVLQLSEATWIAEMKTLYRFNFHVCSNVFISLILP